MSEDVLHELEEIRQFVLHELPAGVHLESFGLTLGTLYYGQAPAVTVLIRLSREPDAIDYGVVDDISSRIRKKWSRDDLYISVTTVEAESE